LGDNAINTTSHSRVTLEYDYFYPVKIVSRSVARRRMRRITYLTSIAFAFGCVAASPPTFTLGVWKMAERAPTAAIAPAPHIIEAVTTPETDQTNTPHAEPQIYPLSLNLKVEDGDTLTTILTDAGVSYDEAQRAVTAMHNIYDVRRLDIGQDVSLQLDKIPGSAQPIITHLSLPVSLTSSLQLTRQGNSFAVKKMDIPLERKLARAGGRIESSLYETGIASGLPASVLEEVISAYSYDVDFQRDIQPGNAMDVLFERLETKDGEVAGHGDVLFADLDLGGRDLKIFRYVDKDGHADYYNEKGESIRKALLRTPVNGARISSGFGMRNHPILGYTRMHRGVDFAAPVGTPIYAAGDGTIEYAGRLGGYGNYLRIRHNGTYASAYAHISRFASGMTEGHKVKQGQIIAYVGQTGMATGPHLHYEILVHGTQVNPAGIKFKTGGQLGGKELASFRKQVQHIEEQLASVPSHDGKLAMNVQ